MMVMSIARPGAAEGESNANINSIEDVIEMLGEGATIPQGILGNVKKVGAELDRVIAQADARMKVLQDKALKLTQINIRTEAFNKLHVVKKSMRAARKTLKSLADKTKIACEDLEIYIEAWSDDYTNEDKKTYLKEQFYTLDKLMDESVKILSEADAMYVVAIEDVYDIGHELSDFNRRLQKMLDESSEENKAWKDTTRSIVYGTNAGVTVALAGLDVAGCSGLCSLIGNSITWTASVTTVETLIAIIQDQLKDLDNLGNSMITDIGNIRTTCQDIIKELEAEQGIVRKWRNNVEDMDDKLDRLALDKFLRLKLYRETFLRAIRALDESAEEYLALPELPDNDQRKRRDLDMWEVADDAQKEITGLVTKRHQKMF